jgi:hypothetical protein
MPEADARTLLVQIEEKIRASDIEVADRDRLIRFRTILEQDLGHEAPVIVAKADSESHAGDR